MQILDLIFDIDWKLPIFMIFINTILQLLGYLVSNIHVLCALLETFTNIVPYILFYTLHISLYNIISIL